MPHEIMNVLSELREGMRQRLFQVPEYRALMALDRSIEEIGQIMRDNIAPAPMNETRDEMASAPEQTVAACHPAQVTRNNAIASAFAETLTAKLDQRQAVRATGAHMQGLRALGA